MEALVELHDNITYYLGVILFSIGLVLVPILKKYSVYLEGSLDNPPKPHAFTSLPLQSSTSSGASNATSFLSDIADCEHTIKQPVTVTQENFEDGQYPECDFNPSVNEVGRQVQHAAVNAANEVYNVCADCSAIICANCNLELAEQTILILIVSPEIRNYVFLKISFFLYPIFNFIRNLSYDMDYYIHRYLIRYLIRCIKPLILLLQILLCGTCGIQLIEDVDLDIIMYNSD